MNREQAINYLFSCGFTNEQVGEVVRALTYKPRDCANCKHYVVTDTRTNWGSQGTTKIYGCERWECEYEPTTKNDSSELEKNSKKLEKDFDELDCISRADAIKAMQNKAKKLKNEDTINGLCGAAAILYELPSVTPQLFVPEVTALAEWTTKLTKASEDAYNKGYADGMKAQAEPKTKIEESNFSREQYALDIDTAWKCGYEAGKKENSPINICPHCGEYIGEEE